MQRKCQRYFDFLVRGFFVLGMALLIAGCSTKESQTPDPAPPVPPATSPTQPEPPPEERMMKEQIEIMDKMYEHYRGVRNPRNWDDVQAPIKELSIKLSAVDNEFNALSEERKQAASMNVLFKQKEEASARLKKAKTDAHEAKKKAR